MEEVSVGVRPGLGIFFGWWVLAASFIGLVFGATSLLIYGVGVFVRPLEAEFGWNRAQISFATTIVLYLAVLTNPVQGWLIDRYGARRIILLSIPAFSLAVALLYFLPASLAAFYAAWALIAVCGLALWSGPYNKIIAHWFDRKLGLALGIAAAGQGLGATIVPAISQYLIAHFGWRFAYLGLAAVTFLLTFPMALLLLHDRPSDRKLHPDGAAEGATRNPLAAGYDLRSAVRMGRFWLVTAAYFLMGIMTAGITIHQVPMLIETGMSPQNAAFVASALGIGLIVGRLAVGYLLDHFFAPYVMILSLLGPVAGLSLYGVGIAGGAAFLLAGLIGFGIGAEVDLLGFLVPRYFGRQAYGKLYGIILSGFMIGAGLGAFVVGYVRTATGAYPPALWGLVALAILCMLLFARLGPYADFSRAAKG